MREFFIKSILGFLFGLTGKQWEEAIETVINLARNANIDNDGRALRFVSDFAKDHPRLKTWVIETLRNLAVGFARKKGWI
jgi:hypothetical protein